MIDALPCRYHGCTNPATTILVTFIGWCEERCATCAHRIIDPLSCAST